LSIKDYIISKFTAAFKSIGVDNPTLDINIPRDNSLGDFSLNSAMTYAKQLKKNPRDLAHEIIRLINLPDRYIKKAEVAGPGFINLFISDEYFTDKLNEIDECFGKLNINQGKTANVEWVSANPTGPLHTGHGRQIALGKAVSNLLEWTGYKVTREYYYNNAGRQMDKLAESVYARYRQIIDPDYPFPEDAYHGEYIGEIAADLFSKYDDELIDSDNKIFRDAAEQWCFNSIRKTLHRMGIRHDIFFNESSLYETGKISEILTHFRDKNLSYEKDGAVWLKISEINKNAVDKVIVKSSGEPTYRLPDMAYHIDKIKRGYDLIVDIFGADHADTSKEVIAGVASLGYDVSIIKVILHQMVTFVEGGKPVKMSKRADNVYYLDELLNDVGEDVAQFFFVMRSANTHLEFDIELAKQQSEKNPVFYLQYAHARICGILRNSFEVFGDKWTDEKINLNELKSEEEISLIKILLNFPDVVETSARWFEPHRIINYLNDVAEAFHRFYHNLRVIDVRNKTLSLARLKLCVAAKTVLKNGFEIIGISAPERM
jgi:arginyl-tRNA synthetase